MLDRIGESGGGADGEPFPLAGKTVWVAGHTGLAGSAIVSRLKREPCRIVTIGHRELDLTRQQPTERFLATTRPDVIVIAAARVGGIVANQRHPAEFLYDNAMIALNVMHAAFETGVGTVLFLGSSCIYPREAPQPMREDMLLTGPLEPTNEAYAIAKIAGLKYAEACNRQYGRRFITAMPTNLYGPNDNFDPETSHVLPALIRRFHEARLADAPTVTLWGTGRPLREFLHADDMADACVFLIKHYCGPEPVNIGSGDEISIGDLARLVARVVGYRGTIVQDTTKPDGTPRKRQDTAKLDALGWRARVPLEEGLRDTYAHWLVSEAAKDCLAERRSIPAE